MKKKNLLRLFVPALLFMALAGCHKAAPTAKSAGDVRAEGPIILVVIAEVPPYAYVDEATGEVRGVDIEISRAAAARLGRPLEVRQRAFVELLPALRRGEADLAGGAITITEGRRHDVDFSDSYAVEGAAFLYHANAPVPTMIRAEKLRVGTVASTTPDFYLARHGIDPIRYKRISKAIDDLRAHRLDTVFYDRALLAATAEDAGGALAVTPLETRENYGIAVRKGCPDLLAAVNAAISERNAK